MVLSIRDIILLTISELPGGIKSKTQLHKLMYFLRLETGKDFGFEPYFYGPYSSKVEAGLNELVGIGFLTESVAYFGYDNKGFERKRYEYGVSGDGDLILEHLRSKNPEEYEKIKEFLDKINEVNLPDYLTLSIAAKAYLILDTEGKSEGMSREEILIKSRNFNWNIDSSDLNRAVEFLDKMGYLSYS